MTEPPSRSVAQEPFDDLDALDEQLNESTAAVLLETILATLGLPLPSPGYFDGVRSLCDDRGAKLILDEVQTGLGRTGRIWALEYEDVMPDSLVPGKGLRGGIYPITAILMTRELHELFVREPFIRISTLGGPEPGCAAGLAVLDIIESLGFLVRANALGRRFEAGSAVQTPQMPGTAKAMLGFMMMGMMVMLAGIVTNFVGAAAFPGAVADLSDNAATAVAAAGLRAMGVAVYLTGIAFGLGTIIEVLRFQTIRIREVAVTYGHNHS